MSALVVRGLHWSDHVERLASATELRRALRVLGGGREAYYANLAAYYEQRYGLAGARGLLSVPMRTIRRRRHRPS